MITNEAATYLWDARTAAERIPRFVGGRGYDDYLADDLVQTAVERQFEIIGEAFARRRRVTPVIADAIPDLSRIIASRNVLIQGYAAHANARLILPQSSIACSWPGTICTAISA